MHMKVAILGAVGALQLHGGVRRHQRDDAIDNGNDLPGVVLAGRRPNVLALVALASRTQRHGVIAHLAVVVALAHRVEIARIAFSSAGGALAAPAAAAIAPDLRVQEGVALTVDLHREDHVGRPDLALLAAAAGVLRHEIARRMISERDLGRRRGRRRRLGGGRSVLRSCRRRRRGRCRRRGRRWRGCRSCRGRGRRAGRRSGLLGLGDRSRLLGLLQRGQGRQAAGRRLAAHPVQGNGEGRRQTVSRLAAVR